MAIAYASQNQSAGFRTAISSILASLWIPSLCQRSVCKSVSIDCPMRLKQVIVGQLEDFPKEQGGQKFPGESAPLRSLRLAAARSVVQLVSMLVQEGEELNLEFDLAKSTPISFAANSASSESPILRCRALSPR